MSTVVCGENVWAGMDVERFRGRSTVGMKDRSTVGDDQC